jgi:hypothetical protein
LTISTGWFNKTFKPKVFRLERDFVYAVNEPWISRQNLMNIFDDKDIPYEYYEEDKALTGIYNLVTGTIDNTTCIQLGEDTYITTNEIVSNNRRFGLDDLVYLKNNNSDIFYGEELDGPTINEITNAIDSINTFIIHLYPTDFGTSPEMSIDTLISKIENENKKVLNDTTIYIIYVAVEKDEGNDRWILDTDNKKKYVNNGDFVTCTQLQVLNKKILN